MLKPTKLAQAMALAMILPGVAVAEFEISGEAKIEYSLFTKEGLVTGATTPHDSFDAMKSEPSIKLFINSDVGEKSAFHAELLFADDGEAASSRLEGGEPYSQYEVLREFYFDTQGAGWDWRLGKQQVVWGTADGIKLLDIINPTDYRELNQNTSEDSRIPVWMINAEKTLDNGSNIQVIVSEARPNFIAGLDADADSGAPFIFKGVDTITGATNGFLNIANDMGKTSGVFGALLSMGGVTGLVANDGTPTAPLSAMTVSQFTSLDLPTFGAMAPSVAGAITASNGLTQAENQALFTNVFAPMMGNIIGSGATNTGNDVLDLASNNREMLFSQFAGFMGTITDPTTLQALGKLMTANVYTALSAQGVDTSVAAQVAGALTQATGTTVTEADVTGMTTVFQGAIQTAAMGGMQQAYFSNGTTNQFNGSLDTSNPTAAFDYMGGTAFATFNDFVGMTTEYRQDHPDGEANLGFRYKAATDSGMNYSLNYLYAYDSNPIVNLSWEDQAGNTLNTEDVPTGMGNTSINLTNADGSDFNPMVQGPAKLIFTETMERVNNLGASFDMALDTESVPVVLRGEFLYQVGAYAPVIDKSRLDIGDLTGALKMVETDYFKYVMGVDITVMTNLLISTQLIQMYNLDYVDENSDSGGNPCGSNTSCGRYTGDFSSMSLTNGLNKGDEVETFVSFFLSKPFGSDVQHRWNNILISENGGGYWNRFDVEYSFNDEMVGTVEYNKYWGDEDTTFGQFENSSNLQLGFKYIF